MSYSIAQRLPVLRQVICPGVHGFGLQSASVQVVAGWQLPRRQSESLTQAVSEQISVSPDWPKNGPASGIPKMTQGATGPASAVVASPEQVASSPAIRRNLIGGAP